MKSIKTKIIVSIIACTLLSAIPVGFMSLRNVYQTSNQGAEQISDIAENVTNVSETISQSAQGVSQIAEKSSDAAAKTTEGYELLRESRDSIAKLGTIIERFQL